MGLAHSPRIVTDGLVLCLDAANVKSYPGILGSELVTNSIITQIDGTTFNVFRDATQAFNLTLCNVEAGKTYYVDYLITSYTGTVGATFRISNSSGNLTPTIGINAAGRFNRKFTASVSGSLTINGDNAGTDFLVDYVSVREVLSGTGLTCFDLSGNLNNGTLTNGPTFATTNGGSIVFDGSNDDMTAPASLAMSSFTINYWIYLDDTINWAARFDISSTNIPGNVNGRLLFYRLSTTTLQFYLLFPDLVASTVNVTNANTLFTGKWKYVSLSSSTVASNTTMSVYIDGILNNSLIVAKTPTATSSSLYFMRNVGATNPTKGKLAAIQVYNRALSATEIQQNFNALRGRFGI